MQYPYILYVYGVFCQLINSFFIIKFQYTVKQILPKKRHIRNLATFKSKVKKKCIPQILYEAEHEHSTTVRGQGGGIWGGGKERKNPLIWIRFLTNILTIPHRHEQSIKDGLKQCNDFLLYFQFGVNLINHSSVDQVSASMKR